MDWNKDWLSKSTEELKNSIMTPNIMGTYANSINSQMTEEMKALLEYQKQIQIQGQLQAQSNYQQQMLNRANAAQPSWLVQAQAQTSNISQQVFPFPPNYVVVQSIGNISKEIIPITLNLPGPDLNNVEKFLSHQNIIEGINKILTNTINKNIFELTHIDIISENKTLELSLSILYVCSILHGNKTKSYKQMLYLRKSENDDSVIKLITSTVLKVYKDNLRKMVKKLNEQTIKQQEENKES